MIYIRQADYDKWAAIENKPEWLHEHLNRGILTEAFLEEQYNKAARVGNPEMSDPIEPTLTPPENTAWLYS